MGNITTEPKKKTELPPSPTERLNHTVRHQHRPDNGPRTSRQHVTTNRHEASLIPTTTSRQGTQQLTPFTPFRLHIRNSKKRSKRTARASPHIIPRPSFSPFHEYGSRPLAPLKRSRDELDFSFRPGKRTRGPLRAEVVSLDDFVQARRRIQKLVRGPRKHLPEELRGNYATGPVLSFSTIASS